MISANELNTGTFQQVIRYIFPTCITVNVNISLNIYFALIQSKR